MDEILDCTGRRRPIRIHEIKARKRAIEAARFAIANPHLNRDEVAEQFQVVPSGVSLALVILKHGSETEIGWVERGERGLRPIYDLVAARVPPEVRQQTRKVKAISRGQVAEVQHDAAIWAQLKQALELICGLPQPADVVRIARGNHVRAGSVNRTVVTAFSWITEFSDVWTK